MCVCCGFCPQQTHTLSCPQLLKQTLACCKLWCCATYHLYKLIYEVWQYPWCKAYWCSQHGGANLVIGAQQQQGLSRHQDGFVHLWVATNHPQVYFPFDVSSSTLQFRLLSLYPFILDAHEMHMYKSRKTCVHWWVASLRLIAQK